MAIELTYGDDADQPDIDHAILYALGKKPGYTVQLTTATGAEDVVVVAAPSGDALYYRRFDEPSGEAVGPQVAIDATDIWGIKVY